MGILDRFLRPAPVTLTPITAAVVSSGNVKSMDNYRESREGSEAWDVWRKVGEIHYATTQQARLVSRLDWRVSLDGDQLDAEKTGELLRAAFGNNLEDLNREAALHLQVPGGYILARTRPGDANSWEVMPGAPSQKERKRLETADVRVTVRNPDPKDSDRNDSPVIAALDIAREIILARGQSRAASRSRTAQLNTLIYPIEGAGGDHKKFEADLTAVMVAPLADEKSTAAVVPNLIGFPGELIEKWRTLDLTGPVDEKLHLRIESLIRQLALVMDVPPEIMLGFGDTNHWSTWAIQEDNWLGHVEPLAKPIGRGLAEALKQATMQGSETDAVLDIVPNPGPLLQRRPSTADALRASEMGLVTAQWTREQIGADETDAPDIPEMDQSVVMALDLVRTAPSLLASPGLPAIAEQIRALMAGENPPPLQGVTVEDVTPAAGRRRAPAAIESPASAEPAEPVTAAVEAPEVDGRALAAIDTQVYDTVQDLVNDTADRVLERLGAQIRSMAQGQDVTLPNVPNAELARNYEGTIPNEDATIMATVTGTIPRLDRAVSRAFSQVKSLGIDVDSTPEDVSAAQDLYVVLVSGVVALARQGRGTAAEAWATSRRVVGVVGGNGDIGVEPVTAAAGPLRITGTGIALGKTTLDFVRDQYRLVPGEWQWLHRYEGPNPHPEHLRLAGATFNGEYLLSDGVNWFPGDHAGCGCASAPRFERIES